MIQLALMNNRAPEIENLALRCRSVLNLNSSLGSEYGYRCVPLCVIDAVWSIGVNYAGVQNVVGRYRSHFDLYNAAEQSHRISHMVKAIDAASIGWFTQYVFQNSQRTSTTNGILKAEAVYRFARVLQKHGIETVADVPKPSFADLNAELDKPYAQEILALPGQRSGIALRYFFMLVGCEELVKPDRMVVRFLDETLHRDCSSDAQQLLYDTCQLLKHDVPALTPRRLDNAIWRHQRQ